MYCAGMWWKQTVFSQFFPTHRHSISFFHLSSKFFGFFLMAFLISFSHFSAEPSPHRYANECICTIPSVMRTLSLSLSCLSTVFIGCGSSCNVPARAALGTGWPRGFQPHAWDILKEPPLKLHQLLLLCSSWEEGHIVMQKERRWGWSHWPWLWRFRMEDELFTHLYAGIPQVTHLPLPCYPQKCLTQGKIENAALTWLCERYHQLVYKHCYAVIRCYKFYIF